MNELKTMLRNIPQARYQIDVAERAVRDCRERVAATEHQALVSERSRAGNAYADAQEFSQERRDAREAWVEANKGVDDLENNNPSVGTAPYNDGLSDFERYYCVEDSDPNTDGIQTRADGVRPGGLPNHSGSNSLNVTSVTCWN